MMNLAMKKHFSWARAMASSFFIALAGAVVLFFVAFAFYTQDKNNRLESLVSKAVLHAGIQENIFSHELRTAARELLFLSEQSRLHEALSSKEGRSHIADDFVSLIISSGDIDQLRLLDLQGMETVRVNLINSGAEIVPSDQLQDKSGRYYFTAMQKLEGKRLYYSALDLNVEHGKIEVPYKPTIRFGIPAHERNGRKVGYVLVNHLAKGMLDRFREMARLVKGDVLLLDSSGYIISAPDPSIEWSNEHNETTYFPANDTQSLWQTLLDQSKGVVRTSNGIFVHATIYPDQQLASIPAFREMSLDTGYFWKVMIRIANKHVETAMIPYRSLIETWYAIAVIVLLIITLPVGFLLERRRVLQDYIEMLLQAIEFAGESIMVTDLNGKIEYVNPSFSKLTGYNAKESIGKNTSEILKSTEQDPAFYRELWSAISTGKSWSGHLTNKRKDGSLYPTLISITPIFDENHRVVRYMSVQRDYTEQEKAQEELKQAHKMQTLSITVGGIAHEFNNILAAMMGNVYLVKNLSKKNPDIVKKLNRIEKNGGRAADMIHQMLAYIGHAEVKLEAVDLTEFFLNTAAALQEKNPSGVSIEIDIPRIPLMVEADLTQVQNVVDHLMSNAYQAVKGTEGAKVMVSLSQARPETATGEAEPYACFSVCDNGIGISEEHKTLLFEPFFTSNEIGQGTGLGLSTAYGIIQKHHGYIEVQSKLGLGSTFSVYLPILSDES